MRQWESLPAKAVSSIVAELDIDAIEEVGGLSFGYRSGPVIGLWPL